ncbi:ATP-binding protein [Paracoccus sp. MBLB3053]|uniref:histidine kinase n=1 Tax=Paracoccus aurantius TaxID=3073814 RepID=A0ABU2HQA2_9RHOB|nr:ATP-binding protein [Paracoccus sp. MBLB3053]MDS9467227.1 ATP-binding protein [Paracoccus sp. MBLB3053]
MAGLKAAHRHVGLIYRFFGILAAGLVAVRVLLPAEDQMRAASLAFASIALTLVLIGGAEMLRRAGITLGQRRALSRLRERLSGHDGPAFAIGCDGRILARNRSGENLCGSKDVRNLLAQSHAVPDQAWNDLSIRLERSGSAEIELEMAGRFAVELLERGKLQLWLSLSPPVQIPRRMAATRRETDEFDRLPVSLLTLDAQGRITRVNEAARELLAGALPGQSLSQYLDGLGRELGDWVSDICAGRTAGSAEVLHLKGERADRFVQVSLSRSCDGQVTAVLSDASAMKTLEAQFVQSQKMQAIGQLAGGIAHDFNNLLTAITGHCDLLMLRHDKADPDYADLDQISQNANRAAALVRQLLAFSRKQTLKPQIMDLRDTLSDLTHLLNRLVGERIALTFDHDPSLRMIRADRRQLEQVMMNLVVNARDAMPQGGDITIATDNHRLDAPTSFGRATLPPGDYVRVQVHDQGCGIADDELTKIFEPFYTTKPTGEGTGLGLSTAYGIVKQTGGYIFCQSVLGQGSTFSLFFPAHDKKAEAGAPEPAKTRPVEPVLRRESDATVLLVEDEAPVRAFASRALKLQGFNVLEASCAEDALTILADHRLNVDVFVTDVIMPGMDGPAWVRTALRERPRTRVIFMSGYAEDVFSEGRPPVPNSAFLAKPFSLSDLTALVTRQLDTVPAENQSEA